MSAHSKTPYITPSGDVLLWGRGSMGEQGATAGIRLALVGAHLDLVELPVRLHRGPDVPDVADPRGSKLGRWIDFPC